MSRFQIAVQNEHLEDLMDWLKRHKASDLEILDRQDKFCYISWNLQPKVGRHRILDAFEIVRLHLEKKMSVPDIIKHTGMKRSSIYFSIHRYAQENSNPIISETLEMLKNNHAENCYLYIPPHKDFIKTSCTYDEIPAGSVYLGEYGKERDDIMHCRYALYKQKQEIEKWTSTNKNKQPNTLPKSGKVTAMKKEKVRNSGFSC